jgi:hypothetical protein
LGAGGFLSALDILLQGASKEILMRSAKIGFFIAAVFALSLNPAFAQSAIPDGAPPLTPLAPPALGGPGPAQLNGVAPPPATGMLPSTTPGSYQVDNDGISKKAVKAAPCSTAARETDGFTTCIGIPDHHERSKNTR